MKNKRTDIQIFQYCHKNTSYGVKNNSLYTPIQVGAEYSDENVCEYKDNTLDNIGYWNKFCGENTGLYWVWKNILLNDNCTLKYVGQCQYRRYFNYDETFDFNTIFNRNFAIVVPLKLPVSVSKSYDGFHNINNLTDVVKIISYLYPEYLNTTINVLNRNMLFYSCGLITYKDIFIEYCEFLFNILSECRKLYRFNTIEDIKRYVTKNFKTWNGRKDIRYQMSIFGFLAERLMTIFFV